MKRRHGSLEASLAVHFVTTTVVGWTPIFEDRELCENVQKIFEIYRQRAGVHCLAFVLMPHHFHAVLWPHEPTKNVSWLMQNFKRVSSTCIQAHLGKCPERLVWLQLFREHGARLHPKRPRVQVWMDRYDDVVVAFAKAIQTKLNYTHYNPVRAGLCERPEDYRFSSAGDYMGTATSLITVRPDLFFPIVG